MEHRWTKTLLFVEDGVRGPARKNTHRWDRIGPLSTVAFLWIVISSVPALGQTLRRPVACDTCIANWFYLDHDSGAGREDWNCGTSTYNGHRGSDFSLAGSNGAIAAGHDVVAAADGTVVSAQDGHFDACRTCDSTVDSRCGLGFGGGFGNHVVINHGSMRVIYAHMRQGSVRVSVGDTVVCGQPIGQIGSSGCTTGAHLHFETRPLGGASGSAFDPFEGGCSPTSPSRWTSQGPHRGLPADACDGSPVCPPGTYNIWTCSEGRTNRRRCIEGVDSTEECRWGCLSMPVGTDDVCAPAPDQDGDGSAADEDCDDDDAGRFPGQMERCGDGIDQDCDGEDLVCPGADAGAGADVGAGIDAGHFDAGQSDATSPADTDATDARPDGAGGSDASRESSPLRGGCSCRLGGNGSPHPSGWLLSGVLVMLACRRRR